MKWIEQFYKQQFNFLYDSYGNIPTSYFEKEVQLISEQIGKSFSTVLELGAGVGTIANEIAKQGKQVTTIEIVKEITDYAKLNAPHNLEILCADFYPVELNRQFDTILYLDGFGVGSDEEQLQLLKRIHSWLHEEGYALIDIYQPNYWQTITKKAMQPLGDSTILRQYGFDEQYKRMIDTWWHIDFPSDKVTQNLACYSLKDIHELCQQADLQIVAYFAGGAMDFENGHYEEIVALDQCLSYRIKIKRK